MIVSIPVLWGDQDALGHVNNTVPIRWFESSRVAYIEQSGMHEMLTGLSLGPILASTTCHYRKQLFYPDTIHVGARVSKVGRSSMIVEHQVYSDSLQAVAADGESVIVVFDYASQRPVRIPEKVRQAIANIDGPEVAGIRRHE